MPPALRTQAELLLQQYIDLHAPYMRNLSEEENNTVGRINETNKLFVNKDRDYHQSQPALDSPDVNWVEFEADYESRRYYELSVMRLAAVSKAMTETRRLHDYDNYQNALLDYRYAQYKDTTSPGLGFDTKVEELGQFFTGGRTPDVDNDDETDPPAGNQGQNGSNP